MATPSKTAQVTLPAGTHWICSCGLSQNFPYCDGGHQGSGKEPMALVLDSQKIVEVSI